MLARRICRQDSQLGMRAWSLKGELRLWVCHNLWFLPQNGWSSWGSWIHLHDISSKRSFLTTLPKLLTPFPTLLCWFMFLISTSWFNSIHICLLLSISLQWDINSMRAEILTVIPPHCLLYPYQLEQFLVNKIFFEWIENRSEGENLKACLSLG